MKPMAAEAYVEDKLAGAEYGFPLEDLISKTGLSNIAARNQLLRLRPLVRRISPKLGFDCATGASSRWFAAGGLVAG